MITNLMVESVTRNGKDKKRAITNFDPTSSNPSLYNFATIANALTSHTFSTATRVDITDITVPSAENLLSDVSKATNSITITSDCTWQPNRANDAARYDEVCVGLLYWSDGENQKYFGGVCSLKVEQSGTGDISIGATPAPARYYKQSAVVQEGFDTLLCEDGQTCLIFTTAPAAIKNSAVLPYFDANISIAADDNYDSLTTEGRTKRAASYGDYYLRSEGAQP